MRKCVSYHNFASIFLYDLNYKKKKKKIPHGDLIRIYIIKNIFYIVNQSLTFDHKK